jgi:hypothetical protein
MHVHLRFATRLINKRQSASRMAALFHSLQLDLGFAVAAVALPPHRRADTDPLQLTSWRLDLLCLICPLCASVVNGLWFFNPARTVQLHWFSLLAGLLALCGLAGARVPLVADRV